MQKDGLRRSHSWNTDQVRAGRDGKQMFNFAIMISKVLLKDLEKSGGVYIKGDRIVHLLCARHCFRGQRRSREPNSHPGNRGGPRARECLRGHVVKTQARGRK